MNDPLTTFESSKISTLLLEYNKSRKEKKTDETYNLQFNCLVVQFNGSNFLNGKVFFFVEIKKIGNYLIYSKDLRNPRQWY